MDAREATEAAEATEHSFRRYEQRINSLEYGIDGALDMLDTLAERADDSDSDLAESVRNVRRFLDGYRNPQ
ncbi:hypothetical protein [Streptomyces sp. BK340]|uniref:hypothetical protein n=1 Tax=Streptomyces sp. BK340 TaxID=2572903 RepID=UPI00119F0A94|nr:hypothetical protein [Streptomyces sp. BK340]TVZ96508.1 hypothetical protein FB157_103419 [Streptomyces sp. BK340]